jgi:hypothetical protein
LTEEQKRSCGCYVGEPSPEQLDRFYYLDNSDRRLGGLHRGAHNHLRFALQLTTVRFMDTIPPGCDPERAERPSECPQERSWWRRMFFGS